MTSTASLYAGPDRRQPQDFFSVRGIAIPYVTSQRAVAAIDRSTEGAGQLCVAFCNANMLLAAFDSQEYAELLSRFLVLNDGVGVDVCARLLNGRAFEENLNGTDFVPTFLEATAHDQRLFLLGARPGVAEKAGATLTRRYPRHTVVGCRHGYFPPEEAAAICEEINRSGATLVLVALGNPLQEQFVAANAHRLDAPVVMMVGALLDFLAGEVVRAPKVVRAMRAEWIFRLVQEPQRLWRRYTLDLARFLFTVALLHLNRSKPSFAPAASRRLRPEPRQ